MTLNLPIMKHPTILCYFTICTFQFKMVMGIGMDWCLGEEKWWSDMAIGVHTSSVNVCAIYVDCFFFSI